MRHKFGVTAATITALCAVVAISIYAVENLLVACTQKAPTTAVTEVLYIAVTERRANASCSRAKQAPTEESSWCCSTYRAKLYLADFGLQTTPTTHAYAYWLLVNLTVYSSQIGIVIKAWCSLPTGTKNTNYVANRSTSRLHSELHPDHNDITVPLLSVAMPQRGTCSAIGCSAFPEAAT
eukprot:4524-Heterococcus_DN1.PRE.2